jgi:hypothetical protein
VSYRDFTIGEIKRKFQLRIEEDRDSFSSNLAVEISRLLRERLAEDVPLALAIGSDRAGSETSYGAVATGNTWKFLRLAGDEAQVDRAEYDIKSTGRVAGILMAMLLGTAG